MIPKYITGSWTGVFAMQSTLVEGVDERMRDVESQGGRGRGGWVPWAKSDQRIIYASLGVGCMVSTVVEVVICTMEMMVVFRML